MKTCPVCDTPYPDQHTNCPTDGAVLIVSHELAVGSMVRGKYRIIDKLGQGGMGVVYLAEDIMLGVRVALKFLSVELSKDPKFIKRFRNEARAAYQLRHPNIVEVTALDQAEDGSLFIAMEYVEGVPLNAYHGDPEFADIPHPVERALGLAREIASGLAAAHAQGTVHRDIKPDNIRLTRSKDGQEHAKILDFGIAAMAESVTRVSMTHGILLTPEYAAPEQWLEMPAAEIDGRTDTYALGCVLYWMLTRQTPFHAHNTAGWMKQHLEEAPKPPSQLRPDLVDWVGLDELLLRMLAKNREDRPWDAELLSLLDAVHYESREQRQEIVVEEAQKRPETIVEEIRMRPKTIPVETPAPAPPPPTPHPLTTPPKPWPEMAEAEPAGKVEVDEREWQDQSSVASAPRRRLRNWFATLAAAQPGAELGRLYVAGWLLLAVCLIARGAIWLAASRGSDVLMVLHGAPFFVFYFYFLKFAGLTAIASGLCIAISRKTRAAGAMLGAIILALVFLCLSYFFAFFIGKGYWYPTWMNACEGLETLGWCGAALMISGLEGLRIGKSIRWFSIGRFLFAAATLAFIAARFRIDLIAFGFSTYNPLDYYHHGFYLSIWWGSWLAWLYVPAAALACICIFFRRPARPAALFLGFATLLYIPLLVALRFGVLFHIYTARALLPAWLLDMGVAGGALVMAAALGERSESGIVSAPTPSISSRIGNLFRRRWVRWSALAAGILVIALIVLRAIAPMLFNEAIMGENAAWVDATGWLYIATGANGRQPAYMVHTVVNQAHACAEGNMDGCLELGNYYQYSDMSTSSTERAGHFYAKAVSAYSARCNGGDGGGCYALGTLYQAGHGVTENDAYAAILFNQSCDANNTYGCRALANAYRDGKGVSRDLSRAEALFTKTCKGGQDYDCSNFFDSLGNAYKQGNGVARNYDRAGALFKKACAFSNSYYYGCSDLFDIAYAIDMGSGVKIDHAKAADLYATACDSGIAMACTDLGIDYHKGEGVAQNYARAAALYSKACNGGDASGCSNLGNLYRFGAGVEQDVEKAKQFLTKGCNLGNKWGCDQLKELK
ncbi:MAG TPA: protein kinase [Terracidiphilus sp.]|jgi:serine/threonine protein kinase/TPR repeat protein